MLESSKKIFFPSDKWDEFRSLIWNHEAQFRTHFSSHSAKVEPLKIDLSADSKSVRVKLRNYSSYQRPFRSKLVAGLHLHNLIYPKPNSKWASASLIVPKPYFARWIFTVYLRPFNPFSQRPQYLIQISMQTLTLFTATDNYRFTQIPNSRNFSSRPTEFPHLRVFHRVLRIPSPTFSRLSC